MKHVKTFFAALLLIVIVVFSVQNMQAFELKLFNWRLTMPVAVYIILFYILGMLTGGMLFSLMKQLFNTAAGSTKGDIDGDAD